MTTQSEIPGRGEMIAGKYLVVGVLGEGGMAVVLRAYHVRLQQTVAIKVLQPQMVTEPEVPARFEREAHIMSKLEGVNAVRVFDIDHLPNGLPYMVLEHLEGADVAAEVEAHGPPPFERAIDWVHQALCGIAKFHALGIIHRDLKPSNLFLCNLGPEMGGRRLVKIVDFGISKIDSSEGNLTHSFSAFGTPTYMSPAQIRSTKDVDARADLWSLGVILYELVAGRPPFTGTPPALIAQISHDEVPPVRQFRPDITPELEAIITKALAKDPDQGFQTANEFRLALEPLAPTEDIATAIGDMRSAPRSVRRPPLTPDLEKLLKEHTSRESAEPPPLLRAPSSVRRETETETETETSSEHETKTQWSSAPPPAGVLGRLSPLTAFLIVMGAGLLLVGAAWFGLRSWRADQQASPPSSSTEGVSASPPSPSGALSSPPPPEPPAPLAQDASVAADAAPEPPTVPVRPAPPRTSAPPPVGRSAASARATTTHSPPAPSTVSSPSATAPLGNPTHL